VDATYLELRDRGVTFTIEPKSVGDLRVAFFLDPDGNELELFSSPTLTWS
jgi:extradiol dioxygenase family protein